MSWVGILLGHLFAIFYGYLVDKSDIIIANLRVVIAYTGQNDKAYQKNRQGIYLINQSILQCLKIKLKLNFQSVVNVVIPLRVVHHVVCAEVVHCLVDKNMTILWTNIVC